MGEDDRRAGTRLVDREADARFGSTVGKAQRRELEVSGSGQSHLGVLLLFERRSIRSLTRCDATFPTRGGADSAAIGLESALVVRPGGPDAAIRSPAARFARRLRAARRHAAGRDQARLRRRQRAGGDRDDRDAGHLAGGRPLRPLRARRRLHGVDAEPVRRSGARADGRPRAADDGARRLHQPRVPRLRRERVEPGHAVAARARRARPPDLRRQGRRRDRHVLHRELRALDDARAGDAGARCCRSRRCRWARPPACTSRRTSWRP